MATLERCCDCDEPTGNAGRGDGSLFASASGPYCEECYPAARIFELEAALARVTADHGAALTATLEALAKSGKQTSDAKKENARLREALEDARYLARQEGAAATEDVCRKALKTGASDE